ncbi:PAS domain-containing protein [Halobacillus sp. ACCC02827]|uniref:PAS domain-containing protein n=1 Tax=Bacillaceae TaxID=186817 RepID=UPI00041BEAE1|nr:MULTISPECIES: PAS domain-containing protein [Bacillaceae]QHT45804.1 PAS domain-containing protein [Bacillus sp. SB49]WJE16606.1 PAS domain-containing protein [Halobacillus sp. ACCC02827]
MLMQNAMDLLDEGVLISDKQYRIAYANPAYGRIFELEMEEIIGRKFSELYPDSDMLELAVGNDAREEVAEKQHRIRGKEVVLEWFTKSFREDGEVYILARVRDKTAEKEKEDRLTYIIEEMTVNIVTIAKGFGLLPLQPILREAQKETLLTRVPAACQKKQIDRLAIQFASITSIDEAWGDLLRRLIQNLQLLGVEVALAGLRPEVAMQFTNYRIRLDGVRTFRNLQQATRYYYGQS